MRYPGQLPANTTVTALVCQRQHISRWPVVVQSTAEILILSLWDLIGWYVLHPAGQRLLGSRTPARRESFIGCPQPYPYSSEDDPDLRKGVKKKHSVLPESVECDEKWVAWLKWGLSPGKFLSYAPMRELKGTKVGWGSISCRIPSRSHVLMRIVPGQEDALQARQNCLQEVDTVADDALNHLFSLLSEWLLQ